MSSCSSSHFLLITEVGVGVLRPRLPHREESVTLSIPFQECFQESQRDQQMEGNGQRTLPKIIPYHRAAVVRVWNTQSSLQTLERDRPSNRKSGILRGKD